MKAIADLSEAVIRRREATSNAVGEDMTRSHNPIELVLDDSATAKGCRRRHG